MTLSNKDLAEKLAAYFDEHIGDVIADMNEIMSIDSAYSQPAEGKPFGEGSAAALAWGAAQGEKLGLKVKNFDNYAVSMTYGDDPVLGILSHLDVVPAGEGWSFEPYAATVKDGVIYGRGAIDDKGPSVAVLWAIKALQELNVPLSKGFRVIFGGNEEGGCEDIEHYEKLEAFPPMVFTPDGSFPVLNCEKGMVHLTFSAPFADDEISGIACGSVINAIPDKCRVTAGGAEKLYCGKSAHGSRPENGENAAVKFLADYKSENALLKALAKLFPVGEYDGASCKMGFSDELTGSMTCALTMLNTRGGRLCGGIDIRYPIDRNYAEISGIITNVLKENSFEIDECSGMEPHYVSADTPLVQTLLAVYADVKGEKGEPIAEGGITYVHNTEGGVAFGAEFPWENNNMHGADEHISIETLKINLNMYANAIARLCR